MGRKIKRRNRAGRKVRKSDNKAIRKDITPTVEYIAQLERYVPPRYASKPEAKYVLGICYLRDLITKRQFFAAQYSASIIGKHLKAIGAPKANPVMSFYSEPRSVYVDMENEEEQEAKLLVRYKEIHDLILKRKQGQRACGLFYELAVECHNPELLPWLPPYIGSSAVIACYSFDWQLLKDTLDDLADYWKIDRG